jgi:Kef-type K+ transport system membrane component KefB
MKHIAISLTYRIYAVDSTAYDCLLMRSMNLLHNERIRYVLSFICLDRILLVLSLMLHIRLVYQCASNSIRLSLALLLFIIIMIMITY